MTAQEFKLVLDYWEKAFATHSLVMDRVSKINGNRDVVRRADSELYDIYSEDLASEGESFEEAPRVRPAGCIHGLFAMPSNTLLGALVYQKYKIGATPPRYEFCIERLVVAPTHYIRTEELSLNILRYFIAYFERFVAERQRKNAGACAVIVGAANQSALRKILASSHYRQLQDQSAPTRLQLFGNTNVAAYAKWRSNVDGAPELIN